MKQRIQDFTPAPATYFNELIVVIVLLCLHELAGGFQTIVTYTTIQISIC